MSLESEVNKLILTIVKAKLDHKPKGYIQKLNQQLDKLTGKKNETKLDTKE